MMHVGCLARVGIVAGTACLKNDGWWMGWTITWVGEMSGGIDAWYNKSVQVRTISV